MSKTSHKSRERCAICGPNDTAERIAHCSFPKDRQYYSIWEKFCEEEVFVLFPTSKLCCIHFTDDSFSFVNKRHVLKKDAVPTLFRNGLDSSERHCSHTNSVSKDTYLAPVKKPVNTSSSTPAKFKFHSAQYCKLCKKSTYGLAHFKFPTDKIRRVVWAEWCAIDVSTIRKYTKLCQRHFTEDDFIFSKEGIIHLKKNAVPSIRHTQNENSVQTKQYCLYCKKSSLGVVHFKFPEDSEYRALWAAFCNVNTNSIRDCMKLCIHHFSEDSYKLENENITIKPNAIPSLLYVKNMDISDHSGATSVSEKIEDVINTHPCSLCGSVFSETIAFKFCQNPQMRYLLNKMFGITDSIMNATKIVCVTHFNANDFIDELEGSNKILKDGAVPTVYLKEMQMRLRYNANTCTTTTDESEIVLHSLNGSSSVFSVTNNREPVVSTPVSSKKRALRYIGDITTTDIATPEGAKRCLDLARKVNRRQILEIRALKRSNRRINERLLAVNGIITDLRKRKLINGKML